MKGTPMHLKNGQFAPEILGAALRSAGYQQKTNLSAATSITLTDTAVVEAQVQAEGGAVRWRCDGAAPTAGEGMILADGETMFITGVDAIVAFRAIQKDAGAKLNIHLWG